MLAKIRRFVIIPVMFVLLVVQPAFLAGCRIKACEKEDDGSISQNEIDFGSKQNPINLVMWYVFEEPDVMNTLASQYKSKHPNVTITPIKYDSVTKYTDQLGLKSGTEEAPDIYLIRHDWLPLYHLKLAPMSPKNLYYNESSLAFNPQEAQTLEEYMAQFFPALSTDMLQTSTEINRQTKEEKTIQELYGIPWGFEGLALFVNIDHFNEYNRANPTTRINVPIPNQTMTWTDFAEGAQKLIKTTNGWANVSTDENRPTEIDYDTVIRYGAAMGNAYNVQYPVDIFTNMVMQNSIKIVSDDNTSVEFIKGANITGAVNALESYTSFDKLWDSTWPSSVESFAQNKVSMAFGRSYQVGALEKISSLHFEVVPFPQRNTDPNTWVTPPYYWSRVVNKDSQHTEVAWDFIRFVAAPERMKVYNEITKIPPARQDLIGQVEMGSTKYNIYAQALPYVQSWYKGDYVTAEKILTDAINSVADGETDAQSALTKAAKELEQVLEEYQM